MNVRDILNKKGMDVYYVPPETTVYDAIYKMSEHNIGALLVMSGDHMEGIVSERDYRNKVILKGRTSKETSVWEIMSSNVFCVSPEESIEGCMTLMTEQKFRHLPVVLDNGKVVGMISIGDLVKAIIDKQKVEIRYLRSYISGNYPN